MKSPSYLRLTAIVLTLLASSSCALIEKFTYKPSQLNTLEKAPKLDIKNFFNGDVEVFAVTQDRDGKIIGSFTSKMNGKWEDTKGVLQQNIVRYDGKKDSRTWLITLDSDGSFDAVAHDMVTAIQGKQLGNAMQMIYTLSVPHEGKKEKVDFEENFYLVDERSAIGITSMRRGGIYVGKSIISYRKISKVETGKNEVSKSETVKTE